MAASTPSTALVPTAATGSVSLPWTRHDFQKEIHVPHNMSEEVFNLGSDPYPNLKTLPECNPKNWWMGHEDLMLRYFTPEQLRIRLGVINLHPPLPISQRFQVDQSAVYTASRLRGDCPLAFGDNTGIHPVFRSQNWCDTSQRDYEIIKPALRIASEMLRMDAVLDSLWTLGQPWTGTPSNAKTRHDYAAGRTLIYRYYPGKSTPQDREKTAAELVDLQHCLLLCWDNSLEHGTDALTFAGHYLPGLRPNGVESKINIHEGFRDTLDGTKTASTYNPTADNHSAILRCHLCLAVTLVHELAHAFKNATKDKHRWYDINPYRNDSRVSEVGFDVETAMLGNSNSIFHRNGRNPITFVAPFGWSSYRWPGDANFEKGGSYKSMASSAKYGVECRTAYGVPMTYVHQFFTDEFWDHRVQRFGAAALGIPRPFGVREVSRASGAFHAAESPSVRTRWSPGRGKLVEDREMVSPDGLHTAVKEGLLFEDRVFDFGFRELKPKTGEPMGRVEKRVAVTKRDARRTKAKLAEKASKLFGRK